MNSAGTAVIATLAAALAAACSASRRDEAEPAPAKEARAAPTVVREPVAPASEQAVPAKAARRNGNDVAWLGLRWLDDHQAKDGSWHDPATTGIALLAFLGGGETGQSGSHREAVKSALAYLCAAQDAEGCLVRRDSPRLLRDHAIAGVALAEAYGMTGSRVVKEPAQRAVAFALKSRLPHSGWSATPSGAALDFETTVWTSMLVQSAKMSELDVESGVREDVVTAIDAVTDRATGRVIVAGSALSDEAATAMGVFVRVIAGHQPEDDEMIRRGGALLAAKPPAWEPARSADPLAWYFGSRAMFHMDDDQRWPWFRALMTAFDRSQSMDGDERGSWAPAGAAASRKDRVWATALVLLSAQPITSNWYPGLRRK